MSRVAVPGTNLTLVLTEDEKQMYRYYVLADGKSASDQGFLGPHDEDSRVVRSFPLMGTSLPSHGRAGSIDSSFKLTSSLAGS
jgi:hypothetical protein